MYADGRRTSTRQLCLSHRAAGVLTVLPVGLQYHLQISRSPVPKLPSLRVEPRQRRRVGDDSELRKQFSQPRLPRPCCHKFATHPFHIATPSQPFPCGGYRCWNLPVRFFPAIEESTMHPSWRACTTIASSLWSCSMVAMAILTFSRS